MFWFPNHWYYQCFQTSNHWYYQCCINDPSADISQFCLNCIKKNIVGTFRNVFQREIHPLKLKTTVFVCVLLFRIWIINVFDRIIDNINVFFQIIDIINYQCSNIDIRKVCPKRSIFGPNYPIQETPPLFHRILVRRGGVPGWRCPDMSWWQLHRIRRWLYRFRRW